MNDELAPGRQSPSALLDLDDVKKVNDERGHEIGNALLLAVVGILRPRLTDLREQPLDLQRTAHAPPWADAIATSPEQHQPRSRCAAEHHHCLDNQDP